MSESREQRKRLNPEVLNTALLDEIAERLLSLETHNNEITPEGIVEPLPVLTITTTPRVVEPPWEGKHWFAVTVINDGPENCWITLNTGKSSTTPHQMQVDEVYEAQFIKPLIYDLRLWTDTATASVRVRGAR